MTYVGFEEVETSVLCHQNTVAQYITTHLILEIFLATERRPGARGTMLWWYQADLNLGQG